MTLLQEYKNSLKSAAVEEPLDLFFYRPIAFGIVKLIYGLPITPNQVTLLSLGAGLAAAYFFSLGTGGALTAAAIWYAVANILDCCDGMLARLQGSGSPLGRLVDGIADWVIAVAIFVSLGIGLEISTGDPTVWYLVVAGGLTSALHAIVFDFHQQEYLSGIRGDRSFHSKETENVENALGELRGRKGNWWRKVVLRIYAQYLKAQEPVKGNCANKPQVAPEVFRQNNRRVMRWWTLLGTTTNRSLLILAALFHQPFAFLWIVVVAGNLYLLFMLLQQRIASRRMETLAR